MGEDDKGEQLLGKNFRVETAQYVTTKMTQFAQVIVVEKPVRLKEVELALRKFGGSGQVWLDLRADNNSKPGSLIKTSRIIDLNNISVGKGYDWVPFSFAGKPLLLAPGRYWIGLGFTGSPVINWFYTYGKPVGPVDGTRYKSVYDDDWSGALAYEFNYRARGKTVNRK